MPVGLNPSRSVEGSVRALNRCEGIGAALVELCNSGSKLVLAPGPHHVELFYGTPSPGNLYNPSVAGVAQMNPQALSVAGSSLPHKNMMPFLTVTFIIALQGVFPPRG